MLLKNYVRSNCRMFFQCLKAQLKMGNVCLDLTVLYTKNCAGFIPNILSSKTFTTPFLHEILKIIYETKFM